MMKRIARAQCRRDITKSKRHICESSVGPQYLAHPHRGASAKLVRNCNFSRCGRRPHPYEGVPESRPGSTVTHSLAPVGNRRTSRSASHGWPAVSFALSCYSCRFCFPRWTPTPHLLAATQQCLDQGSRDVEYRWGCSGVVVVEGSSSRRDHLRLDIF